MGQKKLPFASDLAWAVILTAFSIGWDALKDSLVSSHLIFKVALGWILWGSAFVFFARVFANRAQLTRVPKCLVISVSTIIFLGLACWSILDAMAPAFVLIKPGFVLQDGSRVYYYAAVHENLHNLTFIVWDSLAPGNTLTFKVPELDVRKAGFPEAFTFKPTNVGHERLQIFVQSPEGDTVETLAVDTRGQGLLPTLQASIREGHSEKMILQCESKDYPRPEKFQECSNNPLGVN